MRRPNVLILFADQQRFDTIREAGFEFSITPNLDKLAQEGRLYVNAYSSNPLCIPARHDLITGLSARYHGYYGNYEDKMIDDYAIPTLPRLFTNSGYRTAAIGKMHFCPTKEHHGFGEMYSMEELPKSRYDDAYAMYLKEQGMESIQNIHGVRPQIYHVPQKSIQSKEHHGTMWVAKKAIEWIENHMKIPGDAYHKQDENVPFFLMCGFISPHPPWNIPSEYDGIYKDKKIPERIPKSRSIMYDQEDSELFGDFDTTEQSRAIKEAYYTSVTMVDEAVGRIIRCLENNGLLDETLIMFNSDHGDQLGDKGYFTKGLPYESSCHVPLIIRYPRLAGRGEVCKDFVDTFDIMPTCLDVCGIDYPNCNYIPIGDSLFNSSWNRKRTRNIGFSVGKEGKNRWIMARNEQYKFIHYYNGGVEELYDLKNDPVECNNLIVQKKDYKSEMYAVLRGAAIDYEKKYGPRGCIENHQFKDYDFEIIKNPNCVKYPSWINSSMQRFFEGERSETLLLELQYVVSNYKKTKMRLKETYHHLDWILEFCRQFESYTGVKMSQEDFKEFLGCHKIN